MLASCVVCVGGRLMAIMLSEQNLISDPASEG